MAGTSASESGAVLRAAMPGHDEYGYDGSGAMRQQASRPSVYLLTFIDSALVLRGRIGRRGVRFSLGMEDGGL
jgi:hypothetical protein